MRWLLVALPLAACQGNGRLMAPGDDCLACHRQGGGAHAYTVAGTVYSQPNAIAGDGIDNAVVHLTDATGLTIDVPTNAAGNFYTNQRLEFPVTASVSVGGATRHMEPTLTDGSCNHCHTQLGQNGAEGRVYVRPTDTVPPDLGVLAP